MLSPRNLLSWLGVRSGKAGRNRAASAIADSLRPVRGATLEQFRAQALKETNP
jgi:hypothetical protein